jgi:hypothetical protein
LKRKLGTGRPPRRQRTAPVINPAPAKIDPATLVADKAPRVRKPVVKLNPATLGPLDVHQRYSLSETAAYLRTSLPSIHKMLNSAEKAKRRGSIDPRALEAFKEGERTYITGRSIAARSLPPT